MSCKHEHICKFFEAGEEKPAKEPSQVRPRKQKNRKGGAKFDIDAFSIENDADILIARRLLKQRKRKGELTEDQNLAMTKLAGKHVRRLNETERQQILDILRDSVAH